MYLKGICLRKIVSLLRRSKTGQAMALPLRQEPCQQGLSRQFYLSGREAR